MSLKYIVMQHKGNESIFVFPSIVDHDRMFEALESIRFGESRNWERKYKQGEAISAGFITRGKCHGRSETLNLESRPKEDTELFERGQNAY